MHDPHLLEVLEQWRDWPFSKQPEVIKRFDEGLSHDSFLLKVDKQLLVLKRFRQPQAHAITIQKWAAESSMAPNILYVDRAHSYCLMAYCEGGQNHNMKALAGQLKQLHTQAIPSILGALGPLKLADVHQGYLANACEEAIDTHKRLQPAIEVFLNDSGIFCFCHNDLVAENYLKQNGKPVLIDWEYAQLNNPWFDIASVFYYFNLDRQSQVRFMQAYDDTLIDQLEQPICAAALCTVLWTDILWHLNRGKEAEWVRQQKKLDQLGDYASQLSFLI